MAKIRTEDAQDRKQYDLFGTPDQARKAAWPIPDVPTEGACNTPDGPTYESSWPSSVLRNDDLASVYLFAPYLAQDSAKPTITWKCAAEAYVSNNPDGFGKFISATVTFTNYLNWPGEAPRPIRSRTFHYGPVFGTFGGVTFLNINWSKIMAQPSSAWTDTATLSSTNPRVQAMLSGKQKLHYDTVAARLGGVGALANANAKVTEAVKLLQAYSELGWSVALQDDDLFNGLLHGGRHLPADIAGSAHFTEAYRVAAANYRACNPTSVAGPCTGNPKHPFDDQPQYSYACPLDGTRLPGEPLGNCLITVAQRRTDALGQRYALHSRPGHGQVRGGPARGRRPGDQRQAGRPGRTGKLTAGGSSERGRAGPRGPHNPAYSGKVAAGWPPRPVRRCRNRCRATPTRTTRGDPQTPRPRRKLCLGSASPEEKPVDVAITGFPCRAGAFAHLQAEQRRIRRSP